MRRGKSSVQTKVRVNLKGRGVYVPLQKVEGELVLWLSKPAVVLRIEVQSYCQVSLVGATERLLHASRWKQLYKSPSSRRQLSSGDSVFAFSLSQLPGEAPNSWAWLRHSASMRWMAKFRVKFKGGSVVESCAEFLVAQPPLDVRGKLFASTKAPAKLRFPSHRIELSVQPLKRLYLPGEVMRFQCSLVNRSYKTLTKILLAVERRSRVGRGLPTSKETVCQRVYAEPPYFPVPALPKGSRSDCHVAPLELVLEMPLPRHDLPSSIECADALVEYRAEFHIIWQKSEWTVAWLFYVRQTAPKLLSIDMIKRVRHDQQAAAHAATLAPPINRTSKPLGYLPAAASSSALADAPSMQYAPQRQLAQAYPSQVPQGARFQRSVSMPPQPQQPYVYDQPPQQMYFPPAQQYASQAYVVAQPPPPPQQQQMYFPPAQQYVPPPAQQQQQQPPPQQQYELEYERIPVGEEQPFVHSGSTTPIYAAAELNIPSLEESHRLSVQDLGQQQ
jgi:hypothetical protein